MLSLKIAFRYLRAKKSHRAVNVIAWIAIVGVAVATMAMVLVLCIFNGFSDLALSQLSSVDPDIAVVPAQGKVIVDSDSLAARISSMDGVEAAFPVLTDRALLDDSHVRLPVVLKGVPSGYDRYSGIDRIMLAGEYAEYNTFGEPAVQLSVGVANNITVAPSPLSRIRLFVPRRVGRINPANPAASFRSETYAFSGVFRVNSPEVDADHIIIPLEAARSLLDYDDEATSIEVAVRPGFSVDNVKSAITSLLGTDYKVLDRLEQRADSFRMISVEKWVTFMMLICILVIALFNVVSTLSLLALEKRANMTTLRALGATAGMVRRIFIAEGFLVTVVGGAIGIVLGVILAYVQQIFHIIKLSADSEALTVDYYPVRVDFTDVLAVAGVVVALAVIVGLVARLIVRDKK